MKTTYRAAAFFSVAAVLTAGALMKIDRGHTSERSSSSPIVSQQQTDVNVLQEKLNTYEGQLAGQLELVESARQDAVSAGIQGDGAQDYLYAFQREQAQVDFLQATLVPQIEKMRANIANLTGKDSEPSSLAKASQP